MRVAVIDIGKPGKNLGWAIDEPSDEGTDLDACVDALASSLSKDALALGFEAPQFIPFRDDQMALTKARMGESEPGLARAFSAGAGATVLVTSLVIVPYVLRRLRERVPTAMVTLDWRLPMTKPGQLLLWEAFVTNQPRSKDATRHIKDARLAIADFRHGIAHPGSFRSSVTAPECLSLLGAALLRTTWSTDVTLLSTPCLVVRSASAARHT